MKTNLYALLVGIDEYSQPVSVLQGCVNDITVMATYIKELVSKDGYQLHLQTLENSDATRQRA